MSTGGKFKKAGAMLVCVAALCLGIASAADAAATQNHHKTKKPAPQLPALPSGPTGPVQPIPLDSMAPVPPQVSYQNEQLTIIAPNSTLGDILRAVRKQTGAEIEIPSAPERVVTHLGPGPAREVVAELLNGSRFNYVLLGSPANDALLTRVVLVARGPDNGSPPNGAAIAEQRPPGNMPPNGRPPQQPGTAANDAQAADDATDDAADQAAAEAEAEQRAPEPPAAAPDQPGVKTPQELLQEMQQRQLQFQQQQNPGQPPVPGPGQPQRQPPTDQQ